MQIPNLSHSFNAPTFSTLSGATGVVQNPLPGTGTGGGGSGGGGANSWYQCRPLWIDRAMQDIIKASSEIIDFYQWYLHKRSVVYYHEEFFLTNCK